jgi:hypothetical protein
MPQRLTDRLDRFERLAAAAGLTLPQACQRARVGTAYLRRIDRHGAPYDTALRLAAVFRCPIEVFSRPRGGDRRSPVGQTGAAAGRSRGPLGSAS